MLRRAIPTLQSAHRFKQILPNIQKRFAHVEHHEETFEEFNAKYIKFFKEEADDLFELARGLNNSFSVDMVPSPEVLKEALYAARRLNSFTTASRTIEALREKIQDEKVYKQYLGELRGVLDELGVATPEELGR